MRTVHTLAWATVLSPKCQPSPNGFSTSGEGRTRTGDTPVFSRVLYQLSYLAAGGRSVYPGPRKRRGPRERAHVLGGLRPFGPVQPCRGRPLPRTLALPRPKSLGRGRRKLRKL